VAVLFHNTLTRKKETFSSIQPNKVGMYTCGPTVYNYAHIGNFRAYVAQDLLKRHLRYRGYDVTHVMNLTDVEDKIIRTCREMGQTREALTGKYIQAFFEDLDTLGIERPMHVPAATDHIDEMVHMIEVLTEKGHTYTANGSVYFRLSSYADYGQLSHFNMEELKTGASGRVDSDEYKSEDARDFALWKAYDESDGDIFWETPLGKGRPGWHIECSAMSMKYLGETFDIHCGGEDLIFPHHENEIAQSVCTTGKPFAHYWLHNAYLIVEGRKMSKSLGNFFTLRDLLDKGYNPLAIRWVLLATHYSQPNNFSFEAVEAAQQSLNRIRDFHLRLQSVVGSGAALEAEVSACEDAFGKALDDDLNISAALAVVFEFIREVNRRLDQNEVGTEGAQNGRALLARLNAVTGLFGEPVVETPQEILDLVKERQQVRRDKNFARADEIRHILTEKGWVVEDTPDGPRVKRIE